MDVWNAFRKINQKRTEMEKQVWHILGYDEEFIRNHIEDFRAEDDPETNSTTYYYKDKFLFRSVVTVTETGARVDIYIREDQNNEDNQC